jgi:hypothetical protein
MPEAAVLWPSSVVSLRSCPVDRFQTKPLEPLDVLNVPAT